MIFTRKIIIVPSIFPFFRISSIYILAVCSIVHFHAFIVLFTEYMVKTAYNTQKVAIKIKHYNK